MIRRYPARCNVLAQGKLAKRRRAYRAPQCRRIPRPCGKLHLSGNGSMAWGMDRPAWKPSEQTTSSARSGKSRTCGGWTISCAAWCVRSSSARPAGFTARFRAAGPNPMPSRSNTNSEATGCCFRSKGTAPCPVGYNCKHTVAVLLAARHVSPGADHGVAGTAREGVSRDVRRWLDDWPGAVAARPEARRDGPPEPGRDHLFYVIHRDATGGMRIDPYRAYLKKDGAIGRNFREYREGTAFAQREFLTSEDAALLGRLGYFEESIWPRHYDWPDGEELIGLVRGIVETGRARADDIHGMALSWAEPRRCELTWTVGEAGRQHVAARDEAGSPVTLLPFPTPLFVDPETGEIGVAATGLPARLASWFAAAPPVEHRSIHAVAAKLSRIGQHAPVPRLHRVEERSDVRPEPVLKLFGCEHRPMRHAYDGRRIVGVGGGDALVYPCARLEILYPGAEGRLRVGRGDDIAAQGDGGFAVIRRDRAREAGFGETLREAAKAYGQAERDMLRYDYGRLRELRDADVVFPPLGGGEDDGAGLGFVIQAVPRLRVRGLAHRGRRVLAVPAARRSGRVLDRARIHGHGLVLTQPVAGSERQDVRCRADRAPAGGGAAGRRMRPA